MTETASDRGATLVELVIVLGITALAAATIVGVVSRGAHVAAGFADDDPEVRIAADTLTADIRLGHTVQPVTIDGNGVAAIDILSSTETVRWSRDGGELTRQVLPSGAVRVVLDRLDPAVAPFVLRDADGSAVPTGASTSVQEACTSIVDVDLVADDATVLVDRSVALRTLTPRTTPC